MPIMGGFEALHYMKESYERFNLQNLIYGPLKVERSSRNNSPCILKSPSIKKSSLKYGEMKK
jgi:hypothetical protein